MSDDIYDEDLELEIAHILHKKEEYKASVEGQKVSEIQKRAEKAFSKARRKHALEFLKKLEKKLEELNNKDIAALLSALIANGLVIEDEEELEYWINKLEVEAINRINVYLDFRDQEFIMDANQKKKFTQKSFDYSAKDIENIEKMLASIKIIHKIKEPKKKEGPEYEKWLEREKKIKEIEVKIKKDMEDKKKQEKEQNKKQVKHKNNKKENNQEQDTLSILKGKMTQEGVEANGEYWNAVIAAHDSSVDKQSFAEGWVVDATIRDAGKNKDKIQELRGIEEQYRADEKSNGDSATKSKEQQSQNQNQNTNSISMGNQGR